MEKKTPEDLRIRTKKFALRIINLYRALPKRDEGSIIGKQILRAAHQLVRNIVRQVVQNPHETLSAKWKAVSKNWTKQPIGSNCSLKQKSCHKNA